MQRRVFSITWPGVDELVSTLANAIRMSGKEFDCIYAIPRGGLVPGVMLSHKLGLPMVYELPNNDSKQVLIVDEIYDTGETMKKHIGHLSRCRTGACLLKKASSPFVFGLQTTPNQTWYHFPWEEKIEEQQT